MLTLLIAALIIGCSLAAAALLYPRHVWPEETTPAMHEKYLPGVRVRAGHLMRVLNARRELATSGPVNA